MKKEKILYSILFLFCCTFFLTPTISYAQEIGEENLGKLRGWIIDPETEEPVTERFVVGLWDAKNGIEAATGNVGVMYSNQKGYFEKNLLPGQYILRFFPAEPSQRYCSEEPHPLKNDQFKYIVNVKKGKNTEIRKNATIGGRLRIFIADLQGNKFDPKFKFGVTYINIASSVNNGNFYDSIDLHGFNGDNLNDGEMLSNAIYPGMYKLKVNLYGVGFNGGKIEEDDIEVKRNEISNVTIKINTENETGIEGYVTDGKGNPIAREAVMFLSTNDLPFISTYTNERGYYKFVGMESGEYEVLIETTQYSPFDTTLFIRTNIIEKLDIVLEESK